MQNDHANRDIAPSRAGTATAGSVGATDGAYSHDPSYSRGNTFSRDLSADSWKIFLGVLVTLAVFMALRPFAGQFETSTTTGTASTETVRQAPGTVSNPAINPSGAVTGGVNTGTTANPNTTVNPNATTGTNPTANPGTTNVR